MMPPLQVLLLALIVTSLGGMNLGQTDLPPHLVLFWVLTGNGLLVLTVWARARRVCARLYRTSADGTFLISGFDRTANMARWGTIVLLAFQMLWGGWGNLVQNQWHVPSPFAEGIFIFVPLGAWFGFWVAAYQVELAARTRSLAYRLARGLPTHEMPPLAAYLSMRARHDLYLLIPVALVVGGEEILPRLFGDRPWVAFASYLIGPLLFVLFLPWLLTKIWTTQPLPAGSLRARLDGLAREHGIGYADILVWHTHHGVTNAAILGFFRRARYILMTDALLESLSDRQIEAVFAHEVGHGRHRHMWFFMILVLAVGALCDALASPAQRLLLRYHVTHAQDWVTLAELAAMGVFLIWGFSRVSRRFEHQADWFAARHMAASLDREPLQLPEVSIDPFLQQYEFGVATGSAPQTMLSKRELTREEKLALGAEMFSSALDSIVHLAHKDSARTGWLHPSPLQRIQLLGDLAASPAAERRFNRGVLWIKLMVGATFVFALWLVFEIGMQWAQ